MTETIADVMLFAAGLGTRMLPLTLTTPKPLIAVAGKPLIEHALEAAMSEGHRRFVVNIHHHAAQMAAHVEGLRARFAELDIATSLEKDALLDTGGGLRKALPLLATDPILTLNTDTFWRAGEDAPLARMRQAYAAGAEMVLLCVAPDRALGFRRGADFMLAEDGALNRTLGRPVIYAGAALIARNLAASGPEGAFSLTRHMATAAERGTLRGVEIGARWFHIGDPAALAQCEDALGAPA